MEHLVEGVRSALRSGSWYAALGLALTLPDICGRLANPEQHSKARYQAWCRAHLQPKYTHHIGADHEQHVFLSAEDCYALRCAVLHEGADNILEQAARSALESFVFTAPREGLTMHSNQVDEKLQLQVDLFCEDICVAVEEWLSSVATDEKIQKRMGLLMRVVDTSNDFKL